MFSQIPENIHNFKNGLTKALGDRALFTPTELQLDRGVSTVLKELGEHGIPVDSQSLPWMIQQIGATSDSFTAGFVAGRMQTNLEAGQATARADDLLLEISQRYNM
jgi:hypothetical protein